MKKVKIILFLLLVGLNCFAVNLITLNGKQSKNLTNKIEERIEFISQGDTLVGYLSKPENVSKFPLIVVLHSASHGHHDLAIYNHLEKSMNEIGVGVFTFDRRGSGESGGNFETASFEDLANDALEAIEVLEKREDVDNTKIGLFGISQGGWLAPIAYSFNKENISFMILVSSCGVSPAKQMEYSAITSLKMNGFSEEIISKAEYLINLTYEYFRGNIKKEEAQSELDKYKNEEWFAYAYLEANLPDDVSDTKWILEMDFEPLKYFESVDIPIVLFYGEFDRWVPIQESIQIWEQSLKTGGNDKFQINRIKDSGHLMILNEDNNPKQEIISDEYTSLLKEWVKEVTQ